MMKKLSVMKKLLISYCLLVFAISVLMGIYILPVQLKDMEQYLDDKISLTSRLIACDSGVVNGVSLGILSPELCRRLDEELLASHDIDYIVIADAHSLRLYHPDHGLIGKSFAGGDERDILAGAAPYITTSQGTADVQKRAFHAVRNADGETKGFVMVSASLETISQKQRRIMIQFFSIFLLVLGIGIFFAYLISKNIRKSLLGFEPGAFADMYLQREEILDNLNEGILAVDRSYHYLYLNQSAKRFFDGTSLPDDFPLLPEIQKCLQSGKTQTGLLTELKQNTLLIHLIPIFKSDAIDGILIILRDRTETTRLAEQLTGTSHVIDALRANTHEYLNKLHVISGLLQIGETKKAISFISNVSSEIENGYQLVVRQIQNRTIAALILGKQSRAKELDIQFVLRKDSFLEKHSPFLSTQELITITGNLLENAFDAVNNTPNLRQVELFISSNRHGITITVDDTGCGMTEEQIQTIYSNQYTTKGDGHGIGLSLIKEIVRKHHGYLEIVSEPDEGTSFSISIDQ